MNELHAVPTRSHVFLAAIALGLSVVLRQIVARVAHVRSLSVRTDVDRVLAEAEGIERFCRRVYESARLRRVPLRPGGRVIVRLVWDCPDPIERIGLVFLRTEEHDDEARRLQGRWIVLRGACGEERYWSATGNREGSFDESEDDEPLAFLSMDEVARVMRVCGR